MQQHELERFVLIDCNNFYVSCERAFNPRLENKPVVVLSNNDGCIISRSNEAKKLGIPMGAPFYQWKKFCAKHRVQVFSSNYELYGDISQRVMSLLKEFNSAMEIYSIDEAFFHLKYEILLEEMILLRNHIKNCTGIPISIGIGRTKTLAKVANQIAKQSTGVFQFSDPQQEEFYLTTFPIEKVWGVGSRFAERLKKLNIHYANQLRHTDAKIIRLHFNVTLEKTAQELKGISCLELEPTKNRQQIISSRSFGKPVTDVRELEEAISLYTTIAAAKLRRQRSVTSSIYVFLQTNQFNEHQPQYGNAIQFSFPAPTADTCYLIYIAKKCVQHIFQKGFQYHKAGIMLLNISPQSIQQYDMLLKNNLKREQLMFVLDSINKMMGRNTLFVAAQGIKRNWIIKCDKRSQRYTTRWNELPIAYCL